MREVFTFALNTFNGLIEPNGRKILMFIYVYHVQSVPVSFVLFVDTLLSIYTFYVHLILYARPTRMKVL